MRTSATPGTVCSRGLTMRLTRSVICSGLSVSLVKASQIDRDGVGLDLGDHRLVDRVGQLGAHARDLVAHLGGGGVGILLEPEAHRDLALLGREIEVMMSTPSMPAIESSSGLVTCDSITSDDAPTSRV